MKALKLITLCLLTSALAHAGSSSTLVKILSLEQHSKHEFHIRIREVDTDQIHLYHIKYAPEKFGSPPPYYASEDQFTKAIEFLKSKQGWWHKLHFGHYGFEQGPDGIRLLYSLELSENHDGETAVYGHYKAM